jgi:hypothetical protein
MIYKCYKVLSDWVCFILFAQLLALFISGCADKTATETKINTNKTKATTSQVRFIGQWLNEGKREKLVRDFTRKYEFENQDVKVVLKFPEEIYFDRSDIYSNQRFISKIMVEPNPEWDIIRINDQFEEVASFSNDPEWAKKYLVDFSTIPEFRKNTLPQLLSEEIKNRWGGIIPGPFIEGQYWALWSNSVVAKKVGVNIKQYGMTGNDLVSYVKAVDAYNKKNPGDYIVPIHDATDWRTAFAMAYQLYVSELNDKKELLTTPITEKKLLAWHKTLKLLEELSAYNPCDPNVGNVNWSDSRFDLLNEKCLFYSNGAWMYNIWEGENPLKTKNCIPNEFPTFNSVNLYPGAYQIMWAVLKNSPNRDKAVDFLLAMNTPDIAEMWVQYTKCPTGIKGKLTDVSFGSDQFEEFSYYIQNHYGENTYRFTEVVSQYMIGNSNNLSTHYRDVLMGKMTADEAMRLIRQSIRR